jgi:small GTP-binding protein
VLWQVFQYRKSAFTSLAWSPDGQRIAAGALDGCIWIFDAHSGKQLGLLEGHTAEVFGVAFSPDGKLLASGSSDGTVRFWNADTGQTVHVCEGHSGDVYSVAFSPDGKLLASGADDQTVRLWDVASRKCVRVCEGHTKTVRRVAFSPDGEMVASASWDHTVRLWQTDNGKAIRVFQHPNLVYAVAFSPDQRIAATECYDQELRLWDIASGNIIRSWQGTESGDVWAVSFSRDGKWIVTGCSDNTMRLWNTASGKSVRKPEAHGGAVAAVVFSPDGRLLASACYDATIRLWDANWREIQACRGHSNPFDALAFSPDKKVIASAPDGYLVLSRATNVQKITVCTVHDRVTAAALSPDGKIVASGSFEDRCVGLWDAATGRQLAELEGHSTSSIVSVAFSSNGKMLASGSDDKTARLWDTQTGKQLAACEGHSDSVSAVAFRLDGKVLASGSADKTVRLWEAPSGKPLNELRGHTDGVTRLRWTADGSFLISSTEQGETILWRCSDWSIAAQWPSRTYRHRCVDIVESESAPEIPSWMVAFPLDIGQTAGFPAAQIKFRCARVLLIGDGGVGKTSLAYRLQYNDHKDHDSTHGLQVWKLDAKTLFPGAQIGSEERREVFLWDLGGQEAYRILHQLFFPDTRLAVFVYVPRGQRDVEVLEDWNNCLEAQLETGSRIPKLLVRSKIDSETLPDPASLKQLVEHCGFSQPLRLSAKTGAGVEEFRRALYEKLDWISVTELAIFRQVRDEVERAWQSGKVTMAHQELEEGARSSRDYTPERFAEAVRLVKEEGLAFDITLESAGRLLVNPEPLERYAGSIILEAMRGKSAPVVEYRWVMTTGAFQRIDKRLPREKELLILECAVQLLVARRVCLLVDRMLVFPQLFEERAMAPASTAEAVRSEFAYDFTGPIQHVYANIAVSLALAGRFGEPRYWADRAEYRLASGEFFGLAVHRGDRKRFGKGEIEIYFSLGSPEPLRQDFYAAVVSKLSENKVRLDEKQKRKCEPTGRIIPAEVFEAWREQGISKGPCPLCHRHEIHLWSPLEVLDERRAKIQRIESVSDTAALRTLVEVRISSKEAKVRISSKEVKAPSRPIRILHLTDLHCLPDEDAVTLAQPLLTDLKDKLRVSRVDFLVVSGDFSDKCNPEGFKTAKAFLRYLLDEHLIESPERLILVPGNHDQLRDRGGFVESPTEDRAFSRKNDFGTYFVRGPNYAARFRHWFDLYKDLTKGDYPFSERDQAVSHTFPDQKIQFLALNSAWETDILQPRIGSLNAEAVARAIGKIDRECLTIAVWHHARSEWEDQTKTRLAYRLQEDSVANLPNAGVRLVLHGHVHERRSEVVNPYYSVKERMHIMGGGAYGATKEDRAPGTPRMYNLLELAEDHSWCKITTRCRTEGHSHFDAYAVWPKAGKADEKTATLKIELGAVRKGRSATSKVDLGSPQAR